MSRWNNTIYYMVPKSELTDKMVELFAGSQENVDSLRYSIRLVSPELIYKNDRGKAAMFCCVVHMPDSQTDPHLLDKYVPYSHEDMHAMVRTADWDVTFLFNEVLDKYDFNKVLREYQNGNLLQSVGEMHIVIYNLMKMMFFMFSKDYLKSQDKWRLFYGSHSLEKANESTIIQLNYFYDLITLYEKDQLEIFKNIRNDIVHDKNRHIQNHDLEEVLSTVNEILIKYFIRNSFDDETLLYKKLDYTQPTNQGLSKACISYYEKNNKYSEVFVPKDMTWVDFVARNSNGDTHVRIIPIQLVSYDYLPHDIRPILEKMTKGSKNIVLFAGTDERSVKHVTKNLKSSKDINDMSLKEQNFELSSILIDKNYNSVLGFNENLAE